MPGVKNRLQALKKQVCFVSCLQLRKKKKNTKWEATLCLNLELNTQPGWDLSDPAVQRQKKSVKSPPSAATRWHRDVLIPHHSPHKIRKFTFAIFYLVLMNLMVGGSHCSGEDDTTLKRLWVAWAATHKKGHLQHFVRCRRMVVPLQNETIIKLIKPRGPVKGHKPKENTKEN